MNGLEGPVAGNFLNNLYTGFVTDTYLCSMSRCAGRPFPSLIQGVNSQAYCQASFQGEEKTFVTPTNTNNIRTNNNPINNNNINSNQGNNNFQESNNFQSTNNFEFPELK
jgi:hypothetical protein